MGPQRTIAEYWRRPLGYLRSPEPDVTTVERDEHPVSILFQSRVVAQNMEPHDFCSSSLHEYLSKGSLTNVRALPSNW